MTWVPSAVLERMIELIAAAEDAVPEPGTRLALALADAKEVTDGLSESDRRELAERTARRRKGA